MDERIPNIGDIVFPKTAFGIWLATTPTVNAQERRKEAFVFVGEGKVIAISECDLYYPEQLNGNGEVLFEAITIPNYRSLLIKCDKGEAWAGAGAVLIKGHDYSVATVKPLAKKKHKKIEPSVPPDTKTFIDMLSDNDTLTVGALKKMLENVPDDVVVAYQRIEDVYFNQYGWHNSKATHKLVYDCYGDRKPEDCMSDYIEAFSAYKHPDGNLFVLNGHY